MESNVLPRGCARFVEEHGTSPLQRSHDHVPKEPRFRNRPMDRSPTADDGDAASHRHEASSGSNGDRCTPSVYPVRSPATVAEPEHDDRSASVGHRRWEFSGADRSPSMHNLTPGDNDRHTCSGDRQQRCSTWNIPAHRVRPGDRGSPARRARRTSIRDRIPKPTVPGGRGRSRSVPEARWPPRTRVSQQRR